MLYRYSLILAAAGLAACARAPSPAEAVARGSYLAVVGGCHDCHSPKILTDAGPRPDPARLLSGHPVSTTLPAAPVLAPDQWASAASGDLTAWTGPWGTSYSANLTPDPTGLKGWTAEMFIAAMRTGKHAGAGRPILPPMPWFNYARMSDDDLRALFAYLQSLPPITNAVPPPAPPVQTQTAPTPPG